MSGDLAANELFSAKHIDWYAGISFQYSYDAQKIL